MDSPTFKKRTKPSSASSSLRTPTASTSNLTLAQSDSNQIPISTPVEEEETSAVIFRSRPKKTPSGRVKERSQPTVKSRLSFGATGDDAEEESFVVKKSISSTSIATSASTPRRLLRTIPVSTNAPTTNLTSSSTPSSLNQTSSISTPRSIYSKEYLKELAKGTASTPPPGLLNEDGEINDQVEFDELTMSEFGSSNGYKLAMDDGEDVITQMIPTTASIAEAKARRERMRKEGGGSGSGSSASGFISLEVGTVNKRGTGKAESRLVREDDELDEEDDVMLPLGKKANALAATTLKNSMAELINDAQEENEQDSMMANGDEDDEGREWEEAQIKRGEGRVYIQDTNEKKPYRPAAIPSTSTLPSLISLTSRLSLRLNNLVTSHSVDSAALEHFEKERKELDDQEIELRADVESTSRKREWYGEIRGWGEEMGNFLEVKFPLLEVIETTSLSILKEVLAITSRQRYAEETDDLTLLSGEGLSSTYSPSLPNNGVTSIPPLEIEAPFAPSRIARRELRQARSTPTYTLLSPTQLLDLQGARSDLRDSLLALFADVKSPDFRDPFQIIKRYFSEWKEKYGDEYENAFAGLGVVGCAEFWVRLELISWTGLEVKPNQASFQFTDFAWFKSLNDFTHSAVARLDSNEEMRGMDEEEAESTSHNLLSNLIETVFIPRLLLIVRDSFDPFNEEMNIRLAEMVEEVGLYVERSSARFQNLIHQILLSIHASIRQTQILLSFPNSISSNPLRLSQTSLLPNPVEFYAVRNSLLARLLILLKVSLKWRGSSGGRMNRWKFPSENSELDFAEESSWEGIILRELVPIFLPMLEGESELGGGGGGKVILEEMKKLLRGCEIGKELSSRLEEI